MDYKIRQLHAFWLFWGDMRTFFGNHCRLTTENNDKQMTVYPNNFREAIKKADKEIELS